MPKKRLAWLDRPIIASVPEITIEVAIFAAIIILALISRFAILGARVMSHDESLHTYFSWLLYKGDGYQHTPMMHGPLQFHLLALSYSLFGVSDFTARIPAALFSVATIWAVWYYRRYLGRAGALVAAGLMLISPMMLYYGRYTRNEAFVGLFVILGLYAMLRYFETGKSRYVYLLTAVTVLHFTSKETAFIAVAQQLLFLAFFFIARVTRKQWASVNLYSIFIILVAVGVLLVGATLTLAIYQHGAAPLDAASTAAPANPDMPLAPLGDVPAITLVATTLLWIFAGLAALTVMAALVVLVIGYGWRNVLEDRAFGLLILLGTFVLPQLSPFLVKWAGFNPLDYSNEGMVQTAKFLIPIALVSVAIGLFWKPRLWLGNALLFYAIFTVLYTTMFTHGEGFFTGMVGSLGYWLEQQGVQRGSQPPYYYLLIQIPIYEFLPALASLLAGVIGVRGLFRRPVAEAENEPTERTPEQQSRLDALALLGWWSVSSLIFYTIAGEKMPWLTYHITLPMILLGGWALGWLIDSTDWAALRKRNAGLTLALTALFAVSFTASMLSAFGNNPPFQGKELLQLQSTATFSLAALFAAGSLAGLIYHLRSWSFSQVTRLLALAAFALLGIQTVRAAYMASYINYDSAKEYLVYAHAARGVKDVVFQAEEISERVTGGLSIALAYDASSPDTGVSWPVVWYLRDFTNLRAFDVPTRSLRDAAIIIFDQKNFSRIEPVVGDNYYVYHYIRMWWPNQDYFTLRYPRDPEQAFPDNYSCTGIMSVFRVAKDWDYTRLCSAWTDPQMRTGIFQIWLNRDFSQYADAVGSQLFAPDTWEPSDKMRLYIRKDIAEQIWNYGVGPSIIQAEVDPYEQVTAPLSADRVIGSQGVEPGQFNAPRGIAFAPDGSFYVADSRNHRIQHFAADGTFLNAWGQFGDVASGSAPAGTFNEPWGVAVAGDGTVYVADTWNYRIQKFSPDGRPLGMWGYYGLADRPDAFYGPRGVAVDAQGHVFVTDTGNKRVVVFDKDGNYITQFGGPGLEAGQFDEPVGIAVDAAGYIYVADTWNQRVQSFIAGAGGFSYLPLRQWDVYGWFGQSIDNKPFLTVDSQSHVFITDPESFRVVEFDSFGQPVRAWGEYGFNLENFGLPAGIAVDAEGHVWVVDAGNHRLMRFTLMP